MVSTTEAGPAAKRRRSDEDAAQADTPMPDASAAEAPGAPATDAGNAEDMTTWPVHNLMKLYYTRLFPHEDFYKWLAYGNDGKHPGSDPSFFQRREFCFTLENDIFVRYQSFKDGAELAAAIIARLPAKIDVGPVYSDDPQQRKTLPEGRFHPVSRELVFDIDLTDYDNVRTCGDGGHICSKCWPLMAVAIKVLDRGLREDFGFQHILWVFSGRRGIHCWVCDSRAQHMTDEQRSALAAYFAVYRGQEEGLAKMFLTATDHPSLAAAYDLLHTAWREMVVEQQALLDSQEEREKLLLYIPCDATRGAIRREWERMSAASAVDRWDALEDKCEAAGAAAKGDKTAESRVKMDIRAAPKRIVLAYSYPRLDIEVSKKMNHLLKAPFCVHPKTGKVCVPLDPATTDDFNPETVPTVGALLNELNSGASSTAMEPYMNTFRSGFLAGLQRACHKDVTERARMAAQGLEW